MLWYCLNCRKNTESKRPKFVWTKNGRIMHLWKSAVCDWYLSKSKKRGCLVA